MQPTALIIRKRRGARLGTPIPDPEPTFNTIYPGVDLLPGLLADDDLHTILYDASWSPPYRAWVTDRNSTARQVTGLYTGNSLDALAFDSVAFDNTDAYCRPGVVFNDTIHGSRFVLAYFGPSGSTDERVGFATSSDEGLTFSDTIGFVLRAGVAPVPSDITRIFPMDLKIIGSSYYLVALESTDENNISRLVLYSTSNQTFATASWTRHGVILENNADTGAWDAQNVSQAHLQFVDNRWIMYYMGSTSDDLIRRIGIAYASNSGQDAITTLPFNRYSGNPVLTEVQTLNINEERESYIGILIPFDDPVSGNVRYFYRAYYKDLSNSDLDWRAVEATTTDPGTTWYNVFRDLKTGSFTIQEPSNQELRYIIGNATAFQNSLLENITDFDAVRVQLHASDKSNSILINVGFSTTYANPTSSTGVYYMLIRNIAGFNDIRIVENGAVTDINVGSGISPGDFLVVRKDGANLTYYVNDTLIHTGVSTPATLYPVIFNGGSSTGKEFRNFRILVDRIP